MHPSPPSPFPRRSRLAFGSFAFSLVAALSLVYIVTIGLLTFAFSVLPSTSPLTTAIFPVYVSIYGCFIFCIALGNSALGEMKMQPGELRGKAWAISGMIIGSTTLLLTLLLTLFSI